MKPLIGWIVGILFLELFLFSWVGFGTVDFRSKENAYIQALRNWGFAHLFLGVAALIGGGIFAVLYWAFE